MDENTDFYGIGQEFTTPKNPFIELQDEIMETLNNIDPNRGFTKDGRPRDEFSIICNPNESIPIPDTTGNGVETGESYSLERKDQYEGVDPNALAAKSQFNNLTNIVQSIRTYMHKVNTLININPNKLHAIEIIYNNLVYSGYGFKTGMRLVNFDSDRFFEYFINYVEILKNIDFSFKPSQKNGFNYLLSNLTLNKLNINGDNKKILNYFGILKTIENYTLLKNTISFSKLKDMIMLFINCEDYIKYYDFNIELGKKTIELKENMKSLNSIQALEYKSFISAIYSYATTMFNLTLNLYDYLIMIYKTICPSDKGIDLGLSPKSIMINIEKINPWVSADYHLLKELIGGDTTLERTNDIIKMHNKYVSPNDYFLFLGDLSESEIFDQKNTKLIKTLIEYANKLNGKKIMLKGNNDTADNSIFKKCGFIEIYDDPILLTKYVFSHGPIHTRNGIINVHGHIHGSHNYWGIDVKDHIDCYYGLYGKPMRLNDLVDKKLREDYEKLCTTKDIPSGNDPELLKVPKNIK